LGRIAIEICVDIFGRSVVEGDMSGQIIAIRAIAFAAPLLACGVGIGVLANTARADDCLAAPNSAAPKGSHWYYHTDRAKGRKCWFLRALGRPTQHTAAHGTSETAPTTHTGAAKKAASASANTFVSTSAGGKTAPSPPLKAQSASTSGAATREPVRQHSQEQNTARPAPDAPAAQTSVWTQLNAQAPAAAVVWPDPPQIAWPDAPTVATVTLQKPNSVPSSARPDNVPAGVDARASSEGTARDGAPTIRAAKTAAPPAGTLVQTSLVVALGLIAGGLLYRLVMKISAVRGRRIIIDHSEPEWIDDRREQPHGFVNEHEQFIDDVRLSLVPVAGDYGAPHPLRADDKRQDSGLRKSRASRITEQVIDRENTLIQMIRDLDHMLQSRKGA
jgi:hypothetical protein